MTLIFQLVLVTFFIYKSSALDNGLALTPPMGFLSWLKYECVTDCENNPDICVSEKLFRNIADLMVSEGYLSLGYEYLIVDDCWLATNRTENGTLMPDPDRFPSGMKALGDYIHSKGLKFGLYEDYGNFTCMGFPGILGHLETDANTFADWGVDFVKIDACYSYDPVDLPPGYIEFGNYLNKTGRPIAYSCSWPAYEEVNDHHSNYTILDETCNLWRNWYDINASWKSILDTLDFFGDNQDRFAPFAGPGHWNDPDALTIGEGDLTLDQCQVQMATWAVLAAPLLISTNLSTLSLEHKAILQNKGVIEINQDSLGRQGLRVKQKHEIDYWVRELSTNSQGKTPFAIAAVNRRQRTNKATVDLKDLGLGEGSYALQDLFNSENNEIYFAKPTTVLDADVNATGVVFVRAEPV